MLESEAAKRRITFRALQERLIKVVTIRIQNGEFTERGLARILGISQPQIHNVLKGARKLRPELADRLISSLEMSTLELLDTTELHGEILSRAETSLGAVFGEELAEGSAIPSRIGVPRRKPAGSERRPFSSSEKQNR